MSYEYYGLNCGAQLGQPFLTQTGTIDLVTAQTDITSAETTITALGSILLVGSTISSTMTADLNAISTLVSGISSAIGTAAYPDYLVMQNNAKSGTRLDLTLAMHTVEQYLLSGLNTVVPSL